MGSFLTKKEALFCHQDVFSDHNQFLRFCETLKMSVFQKHENRPFVLIPLSKTAKSPQKVVVRCTEKRGLFGNKAYMSMSKLKTRFDTNFIWATCEESPCKPKSILGQTPKWHFWSFWRQGSFLAIMTFLKDCAKNEQKVKK